MGAVKTTLAPSDAGNHRTWTADDVRRLGLTTDIETAGAVLGIGRTMAYGLAKRGEFPVKVLRIGSRYVVPTVGLITVLCVDKTGSPGRQAPVPTEDSATPEAPRGLSVTQTPNTPRGHRRGHSPRSSSPDD